MDSEVIFRFKKGTTKIPTMHSCPLVPLPLCIQSSVEMQVFICLCDSSSAVNQTLVTRWL